MTAPLLAVDLPSMLYRAFYALPDSITDGDGAPVNALLGAANLILAAVEEHEPRAVVLCLGPDAAAYRVELYPEYHAQRPEMPAGLVGQWADAPAFFEAFGWHVADHDSLEADDLLGSYAEAERRAGGRALLMTGDRDMFQCASPEVTILYVSTGKGAQAVTPDEVERRYGVRAEQVPDFIALRGDPSDGLPGARGVGEKTAADLLRRHGSLEGVLEAAIGETRPKLRASLLGSREELLAFKRIATLQEIDVERPADAPTDRRGAAEAARARGMNKLAERLGAPQGPNVA